MSNTHLLVIPYPASGHILPLIDLIHEILIRTTFKITVLVTPKNLHYLNALLSLHPCVETLILPFPPHPSIPSGVENNQHLPITFAADFVDALSNLTDPILNWFQNTASPPTAIISDLLLTSWTYTLSLRLGIPNIAFVIVNAHTLCSWWKTEVEDLPEFLKNTRLGTYGSWGLIVNSFEDIDSKQLDVIKSRYLKHERVWLVGPLRPIKGGERGGEGGYSSNFKSCDVIEWLDSCVKEKERSVVYVGFGSQITLSKTQMEAVAYALEESKVRFIWAVKKPMIGDDVDDRSVVPSGFQDRTTGRGLVITGWVPQAAILGHRAVGSYFSHCGCSSVLECVLGGVLLLCWPMQADHYFNTALLVDELGAAVRVCEGLGTVPDRVKLAATLVESVGGRRPEMRRALELQKMACDAVKEGGTSYMALDDLVKQMSKFESK